MGADKSLLGKKYTGTSLEIKKDGKIYASVGVINNTNKLLDIEECIIGDVSIYSDYNNYHKFSEITVNGENVVGLSLDDIKKKFKEKPTEKDDVGGMDLNYDYGKYSYRFGFDHDNIFKYVYFDINEKEM